MPPEKKTNVSEQKIKESKTRSIPITFGSNGSKQEVSPKSSQNEQAYQLAVKSQEEMLAKSKLESNQKRKLLAQEPTKNLENTFKLPTQEAHNPHESIEKAKEQRASAQSIATGAFAKLYQRATAKSQSPFAKAAPSAREPFSIKIWNTLEWIATSALVFVVLFFLINFQAYSTLVLNKLDHLRGEVNKNTYFQDLLQTHSANEQNPLPLNVNPAQSMKQIPDLDLQIMPPDDRIVIPRIGKNVPIVKVSSENLLKQDWRALEADIQGALREGVVYYPRTAMPGGEGNTVLTGHSSYFPWDPGRYKDVFALLHRVAVGDKVIVYHNQKKYVYQVYRKFEVQPSEVDVLLPSDEERLTLITCTPIGTNLRRLIVLARPIEE